MTQIRRTTPWQVRIWRLVDRKPEGCWQWRGNKNAKGYGRFNTLSTSASRAQYVHRLIYELMVGPIPVGLTIDHLCRNRSCVNPAHMEVVTRGENCLRGDSAPAQNARKTLCKYGHPLDYVRPDKGRDCMTCRHRRTRISDEKRRPARTAA